MSTPLPTPTLPLGAAPTGAHTEAGTRPPHSLRTPLQRWLREPLLHFALLGAFLFLLDHVLVVRADDPRTIIMGTGVDREASQTFQSARGRAPTPQELAALRQVWLDNEVLYREGLAMQVDRGDTAIRERVIFKALSIVDASVKLPPHDDAVLRSWFEAHRAKYDEPPRYDFEEAALDGDNSEPAVRAFVADLNRGTPGDAKAGLRVFKGRPRENLRQSYGEAFPAALEQASTGRWEAYATQGAWRAIRVDAVTPGRPAQYESLGNSVLQDWTDAVMSEQRSAAVHALARKYTVKSEGLAR